MSVLMGDRPTTGESNMRGAVIYAPGDVRLDERDDPKIIAPTDAVIRLAATCICGSDLWPYRGIEDVSGPAPIGHEYVGVVETVGDAVEVIKPGQFVIGSFAASDNTCAICQAGYQTHCVRLPGHGRTPRRQGPAGIVRRGHGVRRGAADQ
jgi:threonine dehydrogenase-like Zn-dependent dehydrogenase